MRKIFFILALVALSLSLAQDNSAQAGKRVRADNKSYQHANERAWNQPYAYTPWGRPAAVVVSPLARSQTDWGWGVTQSTVMPIYHQYRRPYPGDDVGGGTTIHPTPAWPSHTHQFGVYYIRGPW